MEAITSGVKEFILDRGDLHDCKINSVEWNLNLSRLEISISDLNANFLGLPEYSGPQPGRLIFDGIQFALVDTAPSGDSLRIDEVSIRTENELQVVEFLFYPSGKLVAHFTTASFG